METISTAIRSLVHEKPDGDPEQLARQLLRKYEGSALLTLITREVAMVQRAVVRGDEKTAFASFFGKNSDGTSPPQVDIERFSKLFNKSFSLGAKLSTSWGIATVAQHEIRIAMLTKLRDGVDSTITRHREAVRVITEAGVTCLNDLHSAPARRGMERRGSARQGKGSHDLTAGNSPA